ncbi:MAG: nucleotidyltransferase domain-containing protein [Chloroflexota bacterium]|nr:nucleotidyltransferase domain-containing protein [Chloroflexota bacterium]
MLHRELARFINIVVPELHPRWVLVFGSMAQGQINEWSDLDIVVVMETELRFLDRIRLIQRRVRPRVAMDVLVYTPDEWTEISKTRPFVRNEIAAKGRVVYDASSTALV